MSNTLEKKFFKYITKNKVILRFKVRHYEENERNLPQWLYAHFKSFLQLSYLILPLLISDFLKKKKKNPAFSLSKGIIYHARDALNIDLG